MSFVGSSRAAAISGFLVHFLNVSAPSVTWKIPLPLSLASVIQAIEMKRAIPAHGSDTFHRQAIILDEGSQELLTTQCLILRGHYTCKHWETAAQLQTQEAEPWDSATASPFFDLGNWYLVSFLGRLPHQSFLSQILGKEMV